MRIAFYAILLTLSLLIALRPGWRGYHLNARFTLMPQAAENPCYAIVRLESQTPEQWEWTPRTPKYREMALEVVTLDGPDVRGSVAQSHGRLRSGDREIPCTAETLPKALAALCPALERNERAIRFISDFVHKAQTGQLQPPRHHPYHLRDSLHGSYTNFRSKEPDPALGVSLAAAVLICIGLEAYMAVRRRCDKRRATADAAPVHESTPPCP